MANETNLTFWEGLANLREKLKDDPVLLARFQKDPLVTLEESRIVLDMSISTREGQTINTLAEMFAQMTDMERRATVDSLIELSTMPEARVVAGPNPLASANANALANSNPNTNALAARELGTDPATTLVVPQDFERSELAHKLQQLRLNEFRQRALLKRVVTDPESLLEAKQVGHMQFRASRYIYRGIHFRVESVIRENEISILRADVVSNVGERRETNMIY